MSHAGQRLHVDVAGPLRGEIEVPGDKSVSHRALLLNALAGGEARLRGVLDGADVRATRAAVQALGVDVTGEGADLVVRASGRLREPSDVLDCGNSGTSMRLLAGVAAAEPFLTVLTGDASLRRRPMARVLEPLRRLGARADGADGGRRAPLVVRGGELAAGDVTLPVASAQLKSALLLAGRRAGVVVREPGPSRDHTERMLAAMGASLRVQGGVVTLDPVERLTALDVDVPGDISSAAFWLVAGSVVPGSEIHLHGVGVNPTRTGVLDVLLAMGADVTLSRSDRAGSEPTADLLVRAAPLRATRIAGDLVVRALDELPVLAVAAAFAEGVTEIRDAEELRVKESDRIARVAVGLRALGVEVEELPDGMRIQGGAPRGPAAVDATGDHRIAMAFAVAGAAAPGGVTITGAEEMATSYPRFLDDLRRVRR